MSAIKSEQALWRVEADGLRITAIVPGYVCVAEAKRPEDAQLLAAAPRLLKALRLLYLYGDEKHINSIGMEWETPMAEEAQREAFEILKEFKAGGVK